MTTYVIAHKVPAGTHSVTAGKHYPVIAGDEDGGSFIDDRGKCIYAYYKKSAHLGGGAFEVVTYDDEAAADRSRWHFGWKVVRTAAALGDTRFPSSVLVSCRAGLKRRVTYKAYQRTRPRPRYAELSVFAERADAVNFVREFGGFSGGDRIVPCLYQRAQTNRFVVLVGPCLPTGTVLADAVMLLRGVQ